MTPKKQTMIRDKTKFFHKYNIQESDFVKTGYKWTDLLKIADDYDNREKQLNKICETFVHKIRSFEKVHSVRFRVKDTESLIAKIIRKKVDTGLVIDIENYLVEIDDIIGVRALHIFKGDFLTLYNQILKVYKNDFYGNIDISVRKGDDLSIYDEIVKTGRATIKESKVYRSIHYGINYRKCVHIELQTRTIFEEGWSEISHMTVYKKGKKDELLTSPLTILSCLVGTCDDVAELIKKIVEKTENKKELNKDDLSINNNKCIEDILEKLINEY